LALLTLLSLLALLPFGFLFSDFALRVAGPLLRIIELFLPLRLVARVVFFRQIFQLVLELLLPFRRRKIVGVIFHGVRVGLRNPVFLRVLAQFVGELFSFFWRHPGQRFRHRIGERLRALVVLRAVEPFAFVFDVVVRPFHRVGQIA